MIDKQTPFSNRWTDAHLAAIRWHFTFSRSAAHFWSCMACDMIRSDVIMSSNGVGTMYVASAGLKGKRGSTLCTMIYGEYPVDFWIVICSAQKPECATWCHLVSIPSAALIRDSQTSKWCHSMGPCAWKLYGDILMWWIWCFFASQSSALTNASPLSVTIVSKAPHRQRITWKMKAPSVAPVSVCNLDMTKENSVHGLHNGILQLWAWRKCQYMLFRRGMSHHVLT